MKVSTTYVISTIEDKRGNNSVKPDFKEPSGYSAFNREYMTAKELYNRYKAGNPPFYQHCIESDPDMQKLNELSERYKKHSTIRNKQVLLNHERKMLYDELQHPELTLARNYEQIELMLSEERRKYNIDEVLTHVNAVALARMENLDKPFQPRFTQKKYNIIEKCFDKFNEKGKLGDEIGNNLNSAAIGILYVDKNACNDIESTDYSDIIKSLQNNENQPTEFKNLLFYGNEKNKKEITNLVENILLSDCQEKEIKELAVWGAGKFRSDTNFEIIKDIALNSKEENIRLREFALSSVALYLKDKPQEVSQIMKSVSSDGSIFAPLGQVLKDKISGNYYGQKNREYNYKKLSKEDITALETFKKNKVYYDIKLNPHLQNTIDMSLIPYLNTIKKSSAKLMPICIIKDTYTRVCKDEAGQRNFAQGIKNSGDFTDSVEGVKNLDNIVLSRGAVMSVIASVAHEQGHEENDMFDKETQRTLNKLYRNAVKNNLTLGNYASRNSAEYFAVGCEAYSSVYKPHANLLSPNFCNTRYTLMVKDPELYNFIKKVLKA